MAKDRNRAEQRAARALMASAGIKYTQALRILRAATEEQRAAYVEALSKEKFNDGVAPVAEVQTTKDA